MFVSFSQLVASLGLTALAILGAIWAGVKIFASKWLDSRFAERLENAKLEGQKQIEAVRFTGQTQLETLKLVNAGSLDRAVKLNQREFEAVPDIWMKVTEAHSAVNGLIAVFQQSPDFSHMTEPQFEEFLADCRLAEWQKDEMRTRNGWDRSSYYADAARWLRLRDATEAVTALNRTLHGNSIFVHPDTYARFDNFSNSCREAYSWFRRGMQTGDEFRLEASAEDDPISRYRKSGTRDYDELGRYLRERYWINAEGNAV
jgi:hypothetical protein